MALPDDLTAFVRPRRLKFTRRWYEELCYERRFVVVGFADALRLLPPLAGTTHNRRPREIFVDAAERAEFDDYIPTAWKRAIPDELADPRRADKNTYWRNHADNQLQRSYEAKPQTLPAALCSIAALDYAAMRSGVQIDLLDGPVRAFVRPSVFWLEGYDEQVHRVHVVPREHEIYQYCGIRRVGADRKNTNTLQEASLKTCTWHTLALLRRAVNFAGFGDIQLAPNKRRASYPASEILIG